MKHIIRTAILMALLLLLGGCGTEKLYIYNWTYYIPDQVIKDFETRYKVKVVYDVYSSNEEMFAKLRAGGKGYDLVFPSGDFVKIMIHEKMLEPLDKKKIPNTKYLDSAILSKINYDAGGRFSVPYMVGAAGIAVNKEKVKDFDKSSSIFNRSDLRGKMTLLDDMREVTGLALKSLGYSVNSTHDEELEQAKSVILRWKENILKFDAEAFAKGFASGEYWVVQGYAENIFLELDDAQKQRVEFFIPKEGSPMYIDNMVMLKTARHKELAYQFINYIHEPEVFSKIVSFLRLPSLNTDARKFVTKSPIYQIEDLVPCELKEDLGADLVKFNKIWGQVRM